NLIPRVFYPSFSLLLLLPWGLLFVDFFDSRTKNSLKLGRRLLASPLAVSGNVALEVAAVPSESSHLADEGSESLSWFALDLVG
ncbi:unnamed protein product, partial [Linum tenue]